jgi:hypothetical protein
MAESLIDLCPPGHEFYTHWTCVFLTSIKDADCDVVVDHEPRLAAMDAAHLQG